MSATRFSVLETSLDPTYVVSIAFVSEDSEMLRMHNAQIGNAAMQRAHN